MNKPTKVEVGQRWRVDVCGCELITENETQSTRTGRELHLAKGNPRCPKSGGGHWGVHPDYATFLGYAPGYGPQEAPRAEPEHYTGGRQCLEDDAGFVCTRKPGHLGDHVAHGINSFVLRRWPAAAPVEVPTELTGDIAPSVSSLPLSYRNEDRVLVTGQPISARAILAMRDRLKPEPWRPTVDDFDLLPDAPGVAR